MWLCEIIYYYRGQTIKAWVYSEDGPALYFYMGRNYLSNRYGKPAILVYHGLDLARLDPPLLILAASA
ncbi:uncharacterized protein FTOL_13968 [Fusarium torulosum]|uniref:Uncharacterized protein n=1 Tax=Fusarium torulosum TaxID=33205 RepID=A0AAE8SQB9_9HYPO|nr:uncharacterized protein FTOL_13968 [Fusarium torulosum]